MKKLFIFLLLFCFTAPVFAAEQRQLPLRGSVNSIKEIKAKPAQTQSDIETPLGTFEVQTGNVFDDKAQPAQNNTAANQLQIIEQNEIRKIIEQKIYSGNSH